VEKLFIQQHKLREDQQNDYRGSRWYIKDKVGVSERDGEFPVTNMDRFGIKLCPNLFNNIIRTL
jgi:hypothetical protein